MRITSVKVSNYRNINGITVELNPSCNYIIGENNLGKSNFLDLLNTICTGKSFDDEDFSDPQIPIEVILTIMLSPNEWGFFGDNFNSDNPNTINISYRQKITDAFPTAICLDTDDSIPMKQIRKLNYFKYESTASPSKELKLDAKKGMGMLMNGLVESFVSQNGTVSFVNTDRMEELAQYINQNFSRIQGFREYKIGASIATDTSDVVTSLLYLSDGERKIDTTGSGVQYIAMASISILCYIMELSKSKSIPFEERLYKNDDGDRILPLILSIDEPEVHLHPYLQRSLIGYYKRILSNKDDDFKKLLKECFDIDGVIGQIIIVTHSTDALVGDYRNLIRFYKENGKVSVISGASKRLHITDAKEKHLIMHFPELKEAFYSHCAVLIEGETEYGCIQRFADSLSVPIDDLGICVINAQGQNTIKPLRQLLDVFKIPSIAIYDGDVKQGKDQTDRDFFTSEMFFEVEIVKKLFSTGNQQIAREIAVELYDKALTEVLDENYVKGYFKKQGLSLEGYVPKSLNDVSDEDEDEFCNMFSAWFTAKKGILLGRIVGEKLSADLIPGCYKDALLKAQEVAKNAG